MGIFASMFTLSKKVTGSAAVAGIVDVLKKSVEDLRNNLAIADDEVSAQRNIVVAAKDELNRLENVVSSGDTLIKNLAALLT